MATARNGKKLPEGIRELPNGRYQARYPVTQGGVTKMLSAGTFARLQDAKDARALALAARKTQTWVDPRLGNITTADWIEQWRSLHRVKDTIRLRSFLKCHILPAFGHRRLGELTSIEVQSWVNGMVDKGLSPVTVHAIYATFKRAMTAAVDLDMLTKSPCRSILLPKMKRTLPVALTAEQIALLESKAPERFAAMIHLGAWAGLRWQEAAALRWENVDLGAGVIHVREAVKIEGAGIGAPKNGKERTVPISPATVTVLARHRRKVGRTGLLFPSRAGTALDYNSFRVNTWVPLRTACFGEDSELGFHDLRHSYATHMVQYGVDPKVLAEHLGHHSAGFTLDRYGVARSDKNSVTTEAVGRAMNGRTA